MDEINRLNKLVLAEQRYKTLLLSIQKDAPQLFRNIRDKYGWSQRDMAGLLNVDHTYISKIENGHQRPGRPILLKIIEVLPE